MEDLPQITLEEFEKRTGHYFSLIHALGVAMARCVIWKYAGSEEKYDVLQLYQLAEDFDKEHPLTDGSYYMVSCEGAIGVSPGAEYLTKWVFLPNMDLESIEKLQNEIRALEAKTEEPQPEHVSYQSNFCPECGTPYHSPDARFCMNCGTPRQ